MTTTLSNAGVVECLKAEGNALHGQGSYQAYQKYSEAIKENPDNTILSILYASCIAMKEYLNAMHDGQMSVKLDPTYVKGWARIGTAAHVLELWPPCRSAWKHALSCLPVTDLTPAQADLKAQFEAEVKAADAGETKAKASAQSGKYTTNVAGPVANMPWNRALVLAEQNKLATGDLPSSGYVIVNAYRDFTRGMTTMGQMVVNRKGDNIGVKTSPTV
ncbi:hypothetical protein B0H19DRAFT_648745 [Mycena capillaripes]|nr:hypothetical protein B0H19DRAFT_648745 [Mycena capillaripes]